MSVEASPAPVAPIDAANLPDTVLHPKKSYRRKYRKIMVEFERKLRDSTGLFKDEQRLFDISQRLAEQTDQLMELLVELNSHPHVPSRLRYDLKHPGEFAPPAIQEDKEKAMETLRVARQKVQTGDIPQADYEDLEMDMVRTVEFEPQRSYAKLVSGDLLKQANEGNIDTTGRLAGGFLTKNLEEQYLKSLDDYVDHKSSNPRAHAAANLGRPGAEKTAERDREMQIKNPASVYNWLRKNQPHVFMDDDKPAKVAASRTSKRSTAGTKPVKNEPDYDEDGIAIEQTAASAKGKRKRDEDTSFRPKGGHPRPAKKRKEESGKRSKRASMDISAAS